MSIGSKILKSLAERRFLGDVCWKIKNLFSKARYAIDILLSIPARRWISSHNKVQSNKVLFMTYNNDYICNPKYICEEILRQDLPLELVWASSEKKMMNPDQYPEKVRLVCRNSYEFFREMASAKVWVDNAVCFPWNPIPKKKEQFYLQTWHGSMGLKRIGKDDVKDKRWLRAAKKENSWTNVCISNSSFETNVYRDSHWPDVPILEFGHARNDILFSEKEKFASIRQKVLDYYQIPSHKKIVMYGPTFRDDSGLKYYTMDYIRLLDTLEDVFGGEWVLLNRFHFKTKRLNPAVILDPRIIPATNYPDMQELMVAADLGITDYSSWICDFVLTGKPAFIYAADLENYNQERGFYYPLTSTPFAIAQNNDQMEKNLRNFSMEKYLCDRETFLKARGCVEDGHAAERIVEIIKEQCGLTKNSH